jgi:magnesium transporter
VITRFETKVFTWIDVENPTQEEISELYKEFNFDKSIAEEMIQNIERSKIRFFNTHTYAVLQFPTTENVPIGGKKTEIDFIIGTTYLITTHYEKILTVHEVATDTADRKKPSTTKELFGDFVYKEYRKIGKQLEDMDLLIQDTAQKMFTGPHQMTVEKISEISHQILDFKRALRFHKEIWRQLQDNILFRNEAERLNIEYQKIWGALEHYQEINQSLQGTNDSLLAFRTNEIMKLLTVLNFIILPISIIPTALGLVTTTKGQVLTILGFVIISLFIYSTFKRKKWL